MFMSTVEIRAKVHQMIGEVDHTLLWKTFCFELQLGLIFQVLGFDNSVLIN